jgi:hypothetical protein
MGYTHYFTQERSISVADWKSVLTDIQQILNYAQHECGIPLANGMGEAKTSPVFSKTHFAFNGLGDDSHETLHISRAKQTKPQYPGDNRPNWSFCKTARKPYDAVVTAVLCYLSTVTRTFDADGPVYGTEAFTVGSDGRGEDFLVGLDLARKALPRLANELDIPLDVMKSDRWCGPWLRSSEKTLHEVHFCVDGHGYVGRGKEWYRFETHQALGKFLNDNKKATFAKGGSSAWGGYSKEEENIWSASGSFDQARHDRIARAQDRVLTKLFPVPAANAFAPPLFVRPGEMPKNGGEFCYSLTELMNKMETV